MPSDRTADNAAAIRVHARFVEAASRRGYASLRDRRFQHRDRTWMVASADNAGVHVVGGGSSQITWRWELLDGDLRLKLYSLLDDKVALDYLGIAVHAYRESLDALGDDLVRRVLDRHKDRKADLDGFLARQRGISTPRGGFTLIREDRQWRFMTPTQMSDRKDAQEIEELCQRLEKALGSSRDESREQAEWLVNRLGGMGDDARLRALETVAAERGSRMTRLGRTHIGGSIARRLKQRFDMARRDAMKAIYDEDAYPYPSDTHEGQDEVDRLVDEVRTIWENPAKALLDSNPELGNLVDQVRELEEYIRILDPGSVGAASDAAEAFETAVNGLVNMETITAGTTEKNRYQQFGIVEHDNNEGQSIASEEERAFVSILNAYRKMMGVGPLRINDHLTDASRLHSAYMAESGEFAHEIDGHPHGKSPRARASRSGYGGNVGENIFMGSSAAQSAFNGWFHSSGHHRNMLNPRWRVVGAGQSGGHWTTLFAAAEDGSEPEARRR